MNIKVWDTKGLVEDLKGSKLNEFDLYVYLLISQVIYTAIIYFSIASYAPADFYFFYEVVAVIIVSIVGVNVCYRRNGGINGVMLISKFIVLSVPLTIKITVLYILFGLAQYQLFLFFKVDLESTTDTLILSVENIIVQVLFFWRMSVHIYSVNH